MTNSGSHNNIKRVTHDGILYLATKSELTEGQDCHSGSEEQPDEVHYAWKLTASGEELGTEKAASNRGREGQKRRPRNGSQILPEGRFMMSIPVPTFFASI